MSRTHARNLYLDYSHQYFKGLLTIEQLIQQLKTFVHISAEKIDLPEDARVMFITNHPAADDTLTLPAEHISGLKGGNTREFPSFWFPIIRQALLREALGNRRFVTLAHDIGWQVAMQETWHLPITHVPGGRCGRIISSLSKDTDCSVVIFPEGGVKDMQQFHTGFFHIAKALDIRHLVVGSITPMLSLNGNNELKVLSIIDKGMGAIFDSINAFVEDQRQTLINGIRK